MSTSVVQSDRPMVSVLMTVFNRQQFLAQAIESVLASGFRDFELIITDDCSSDSSFDIARSFAKNDCRVHVYRNERNLGDYGNRMHAASLARGQYLKYVDSDDAIYPHGLEVMVRNMQLHPGAALAVAHPLPELDVPYPLCLTPMESYRRHFLGRGCFGCGPGGAIIRTSVFRSLGGFDPAWGVLSDLEFWLRAAARHPIVLQQPALVWWRTHGGQEFRIGDAEKVYLTRGFTLSLRSLLQPDCPLPPDEQRKAIKRVQASHARRLCSIALRRRQPMFAFSAWRAAKLGVADLARAFFH
jgi:glycosyltransferase involved in cell wall biosynthesis